MQPRVIVTCVAAALAAAGAAAVWQFFPGVRSAVAPGKVVLHNGSITSRPGAPSGDGPSGFGQPPSGQPAPAPRRHGGPVSDMAGEKPKGQPLYDAVLAGDVAAVHQLLQANAELNAPVKVSGKTALFAAVYHYVPAIMNELLQHGADVKARDSDGATPLHYALWYDEPEVVKLLVAHGADVNAQDFSGETPLWWAAAYPPKQWNPRAAEDHPLLGLKALLAVGADPNLADGTGSTPLEIAATYDAPELIQPLQTAGAQHDLVSAAALGADPALSALLAQPGFDPAKAEPQAALRFAVLRHHPATAQLLLDRGVVPTLQIAAGLGDTALLTRLLAAKADPNGELSVLDNRLDVAHEVPTPLDWAAYCGQTAALKQLIAAGAKVNQKSRYGDQSALVIAIHEQQLAAIAALLDAGADINQTVVYTSRPVLEPLHQDWVSGLQLLIDRGAQLDFPNVNGQQPAALLMASSLGAVNCLSLLLQRGLRPTPKDAAQLMSAAAGGTPNGKGTEVVRLLLESKLDWQDGQALYPALDTALEHSQSASAVLLISHHAAPARQGKDAGQLLCRAVLGQLPAALQALLAAGLDPNAADYGGATPLAVATEMHDAVSSKSLRAAGATSPDPAALKAADAQIRSSRNQR